MEAALYSFCVRAPLHVRSVELYGSWDNFTKPYRLRQDQPRGRGVWAVCPSFRDIIFDGDQLQFKRPRSGGLMQGGRYWYFYRFDDTVEHCDPNHPCAKDCPLLPGQKLNLLELPRETLSGPVHSFSTPARIHLMTLNPNDRYRTMPDQPKHIDKPHPPLPSEKVDSGLSEWAESAPLITRTVTPARSAEKGDAERPQRFRPFTSVSLFAETSRPTTRAGLRPCTSHSSDRVPHRAVSVTGVVGGSTTSKRSSMQPEIHIESPTLTLATLSTPGLMTPEVSGPSFSFDFAISEEQERPATGHSEQSDSRHSGRSTRHSNSTKNDGAYSYTSSSIGLAGPLGLTLPRQFYSTHSFTTISDKTVTSVSDVLVIDNENAHGHEHSAASRRGGHAMTPTPMGNLVDEFDFLGQAIM